MKKLLVLLLLLSLLCSVACGDSTHKIQGGSNTAAESDENSASKKPNDNSKDEVIYKETGYVEFEEDHYDLFSFDTGEDRDGFLLDSYTAFLQFSKKNEFPGKDDFNQEFFTENALVVLPLERGRISYDVSIKTIYKDYSTLTVTVNDARTKGGFDALLRRTLVAKVKKAEVSDVTTIKCVCETQSATEWVYDETPQKTELTTVTNSFDGKIESAFKGNLRDYASHRTNSTRVEWLEIATDKYELDKLAERYTAQDKTKFTNYIATLGEEFFEEKMLFAVSCSGNYNNTVLGMKVLLTTSEPLPELDMTQKEVYNLQIDVTIDETAATGYENYEKVLVAEVSKKDIPDKDMFYYYLNCVNTPFDFKSRLEDIQFTPYVCKVQKLDPGIKNAALITPYSIDTCCCLDRERLDKFVSAALENKTDGDELDNILKQFDDSFFETKSVLVTQIAVDKGEEVSIKNVRRTIYGDNGSLVTDVSVKDRVNPSSNDNLDYYLCFAVIDKTETIGGSGPFYTIVLE
ncbi:MAG: hypothetical protein E7586_06570 [Ruminococcaceae bacterium]|nr:hypothetical protein [Oscillospiraceae bacterium]